MLQQQLLFRRTNRVLSKIDLTNIFPICGFLYGGNSNINELGIPFNIVFDNILEISKVSTTPKIIINNTAKVDTKDCISFAKYPPIKIVAIAIKNGNLPLHGIKLLVIIDINFSLGESIIRPPYYTCCITTKSHAHSSDKMVVLESVDKCGVVRFVNVRIGVYFRL